MFSPGIECEALRLIRSGFADGFVGREARQGFQPACEVVGRDEVSEMLAELVMGLIVVTIDGRFLDGSVCPLDPTVGPRVVGLGQAMLDAVGPADLVEAMRAVASGRGSVGDRRIGCPYT